MMEWPVSIAATRTAAVLAGLLVCMGSLGAQEASAIDDTAASSVTKAPDQAASPEELALEAARIRSEHCAQAASDRKTGGVRSITEVGPIWLRLSEQFDKSGETYLLYWRGVLAQCMDQEERAGVDFENFVTLEEDSNLWADLVRDAKRRIRLLQRSSGGGLVGVSAGLRNRNKTIGLVVGGSLAASSLFFGVSGAIAWSDAVDVGQELEGTEYGAQEGENPESFREQLEDGNLSQTESRILSAAAIGSGIGSIISLVLAARSAARPRSAMAPPVIVPTAGGAAVLWETRW